MLDLVMSEEVGEDDCEIEGVIVTERDGVDDVIDIEQDTIGMDCKSCLLIGIWNMLEFLCI